MIGSNTKPMTIAGKQRRVRRSRYCICYAYIQAPREESSFDKNGKAEISAQLYYCIMM